MGKISNSRGGSCLRCSYRKIEDIPNCVSCFQQYLIPAGIEGQCPTCKTPRYEHQQEYRQCFQCNSHRQNGCNHLDSLIVISYEITSDFGYALHAYKGRRMPPKPYMAFPLQALLATYLNRHYDCINAEYGVDYITSVPGNAMKLLDSGFHGYTVNDVLVEQNPHGSYSAEQDTRRFDGTRYEVVEYNLTDETWLLFDDVYTTGATINSAAHALKQAGAQKVIGLVLGRHVGAGGLRDMVEEYSETTEFDINWCENCEPF